MRETDKPRLAAGTEGGASHKAAEEDENETVRFAVEILAQDLEGQLVKAYFRVFFEIMESLQRRQRERAEGRWNGWEVRTARYSIFSDAHEYTRAQTSFFFSIYAISHLPGGRAPALRLCSRMAGCCIGVCSVQHPQDLLFTHQAFELLDDLALGIVEKMSHEPTPPEGWVGTALDQIRSARHSLQRKPIFALGFPEPQERYVIQNTELFFGKTRQQLEKLE